MNCSKCGVSNSDTARNCSYCGANLRQGISNGSRQASLKQTVPPMKDHSKRTKIVVSYALIIIAVLIVAGASLIYDSQGSSNSIPINVPNIVSSNNTSSQPHVKAQADASQSGIVHSTANKTTHVVPSQTINSSSYNTSTPPSNETTSSNDTSNSGNSTSDNQTSPGSQSGTNTTSTQARNRSR